MGGTGYTLRQRNNIILIMLVVLALIILFGLHIVYGGLLGTVIIYIIFRPLNVYLTEKKGWHPVVVTMLILIVSFAVLVVPLFFLLKMLGSRVNYYIAHPELTDALLKNINTFASNRLNAPNLSDNIVDNIKKGAGDALSSVLSGAINIFLQLLVMYFTLFFMLSNFRAFEKGLIRYTPFKTPDAKRIGAEMRNFTYSNILGQALIAIAQGTALGIGFLIFGIPDAFFWSVVTAILSMVPMLGSPLIFLPAGIIEISNGHDVSGFGIIIYGFVIVTTIDNVIRLLLGKRIANAHPLITVIGVIIGIPLFGIVGLLYGPLMISLFVILVQIYQKNRVQIAKDAGESESEIEN